MCKKAVIKMYEIYYIITLLSKTFVNADFHIFHFTTWLVNPYFIGYIGDQTSGLISP